MHISVWLLVILTCLACVMLYITLQIMHPTGSIMSCCSNDAFKKYQHGKCCPLNTVMVRLSPAGRVKYNISPEMSELPYVLYSQ